MFLVYPQKSLEKQRQAEFTNILRHYLAFW